MQSQMSSCRL